MFYITILKSVKCIHFGCYFSQTSWIGSNNPQVRGLVGTGGCYQENAITVCYHVDATISNVLDDLYCTNLKGAICEIWA